MLFRDDGKCVRWEWVEGELSQVEGCEADGNERAGHTSHAGQGRVNVGES